MIEDINDFIEKAIAEEEDGAGQQPMDNTLWEVYTAEEADRLLWFYKKLQYEIAIAKQYADDYVKRAQADADRYLTTVCVPKEQLLDSVEQRLRTFTEKETLRTKRKSVKLVNGTMSLSKRQPVYERDEEAVLAFCCNSEEDSPLRQFLKPQPPKLDWATLKKESTVSVDSNGEKRMVYRGVTVPSVIVKDQEDTFKVR